MARLAAVIFSVIFSLFTLSSALNARVDSGIGDSFPVQSQLSLPNGDSQPVEIQEGDRTAIVIPSEKAEESASSKSGVPDALDVRPLTEASLIPHRTRITRKMGPTWFRLPHCCRGHSSHGSRQIFYGRDMVGIPEHHRTRMAATLIRLPLDAPLIREAEGLFHGEMRGFPIRRERFGGRVSRKGKEQNENDEFFSLGEGKVEAEDLPIHEHHMPAGWMPVRWTHHMRHMPEKHGGFWKKGEREEEEEEERENEVGGFMKQFREFLNRF